MSVLADAIARDILAERPAGPDLSRCFLCDRTFTPGKGHGINGRFCSVLCLNAYDAGFQPVATQPRYKFPVRGEGFLIECRGCRKAFVSKGLRCCSVECERSCRERQDIARTMAEVGMEAMPRRALTCQQFGVAIPRWRNGKTVPKSTRFCSEGCGKKARRQSSAFQPVLSAGSVQKCP